MVKDFWSAKFGIRSQSKKAGKSGRHEILVKIKTLATGSSEVFCFNLIIFKYKLYTERSEGSFARA